MTVTPPAYGSAMGERRPWNPWRSLRGRAHITFTLDPIANMMGGAIYARRGDRAAIVIDPALDQIERRARLAHELVHDERGGVIDSAEHTGLAVCAIREEARVDAIVAERLIPPRELEAFIDCMLALGEIVTVDLVAEEFEVPRPVAKLALARLRDRVHGFAAMPPEYEVA